MAGRTQGLPALLLAALSLLVFTCESNAKKVTVSSVPALHQALSNVEVTDIDIVAGQWNFSAEDWPSQVRLERAVNLVGISDADGKPPYVDGNVLVELVVVGTNGSLYQSNLFVDDCMVPRMPLLCFAVGDSNGNITLERFTLGDTSCVDINQSTATDWLLKSAYWSTWQTSWRKVDDRTIHVIDTGEVKGMPAGVRWRIIDSTFRCTGNDTHPLPGSISTGSSQPSETQLLAAMVATLLAMLCMIYYIMNRNVVHVHRNDSAEMAVARSKGITLQALIGQGTFGRVYRGQYKGQTVAVKVIEFPLFEKRAALEVTRECRHASSCQHPAVVRCITHFTVTVRQPLSRAQAVQAFRDAGESAYAHGRLVAQDRALLHDSSAAAGSSSSASLCMPSGAAAVAAAPAVDDQPSTSAARAAAAAAAAAARPDAGVLAPATAALQSEFSGPDLATDGNSSTTSSRSSMGNLFESFMTLLVMEYCSLGNLHCAIAAGRFYMDRRTQQLNLDWICRTALDIAHGLQHLHDQRHLVHRDVSTNNVLLVPDPSDPRGFRAKLSDFGLSTVLWECKTHKTSHLKGTVDFMPPEIFTCGEIRFAVDMYALGIIVYWMCMGEGPFTGLQSFQVVGRKLEELHRKQPLLLPPTMPAELRRLVWDCCHWDAHKRPTAANVARRLEAIVASFQDRT